MDAESARHYETSFQSRLNFLGFFNSVEFKLLISEVKTLEFNWAKYEGSCYFLLKSLCELLGQLEFKRFLLHGRLRSGDRLVDLLLFGWIRFAFAFLTFGLLVRLVFGLQLLLILVFFGLSEGCVSIV